MYLKSLKYDGLFFTIPLNENFGDQSLSWYSVDYNDSIFDKFKNANEVSKTKYLFDEFNNKSKLDISKWYFEDISYNNLYRFNSLKLFVNLYNREKN